MKAKNLFICKIVLFLLASCCILGAVLSLNFSKNRTAFADGVSLDTRLIPHSLLEYYNLSSPIDTYSDEDITVIIESQDQSLLIYTENTGWIKKAGFIDLKQVKRHNDNVIFTNDGNIYYLPMNDLVNAQPQLLSVDSGDVLGSSHFDCNNDYLIKVYNSYLQIYKFVNGEFSYVKTISGVDGDKALANNSQYVFYFTDDGALNMCSLAPDQTQAVEIITLGVDAITSMVADEENLYFSARNVVYTIKIGQTLATQILLNVDKYNQNYDLGNFSAISNLSFRNDNLLITDNVSRSIQEFAIENGKLSFTGFAIAQGKTAYNRIDKNSTEIEKYGDMVAVLDQNKLTIISAKQNFDSLDKSNYVNLFFNQANKPTTFALGNDTVACVFDESGQYKLDIYSLNSLTSLPQNISSINNVVKDVCYQSGYYYALTTNGQNTTITKINEVTFEETSITFENFNGEIFTADVLGNYFVASANEIYIKTPNDILTKLCDFSGEIKKLNTDLAGRLYALIDNQIKYLDNGAFISCQIVDSDISSFTINFDTKRAYYIVKDKEFILSTCSLQNVAIDSISVPSQYVLSGQSAVNSDLMVYTVKPGCLAFGVNTKDGFFNFIGLDNSQSEYAFICQIETVNPNLVLYALAGKDGVVLVNKNDVANRQVEYITDFANTVYITTDVNAYYLPIITKNSDFVLSGQNIRLTRETCINPIACLTFLDSVYYLVDLNGDNTRFAYIPKSFTTEVLSNADVFESYILEQVRATSVYSDSSLNAESIIAIVPENHTVMVYSIQNGVAKIGIPIDKGMIIGYMDCNAIINKPNTAVRNILIALAVIASLCGSLSYFLLRKKNEE